MSTAQFYDGLADTYHALYPDWVGESRAQAESLHRLLGRWHRGPADIADVACGIGTQLIGLADYDRILADPPASTLPQVFASGGARVISFQLWDWRGEKDIYDLEHFQVHEQADGTRTTERRTTTYRAYTRTTLSELAAVAGLQDMRWHMPLDTNFFQPIMTAHRPT